MSTNPVAKMIPNHLLLMDGWLTGESAVGASGGRAGATSRKCSFAVGASDGNQGVYRYLGDAQG